jgi:GntR family transcriptional regulator
VRAIVDQLGVGTAIPSERRLTTELGASRLTVRAAIEELVREGFLVRRHGSGTYVSRPKIMQQLTLSSFSEDMRQRGMVPGSRTLEFSVISAGARLSKHLHLPPEEKVIRVRRLRLADGETMAIETLHMPKDIVPGLRASDLENQSLYELLEERYGILIVSGTQTIEPTVISEDEAELLGVPLHAPAFLFQHTTRTDDGRVVEFVRSIYRGDRYRLVAELAPRRERRWLREGKGVETRMV